MSAWFSSPLVRLPDLVTLHERWPQRYPYLAASAAHGTAQSRYSLLFRASDEHLVLNADGSLDLPPGLQVPVAKAGFLATLRHWMAQLPTVKPESQAPPFIGGWFVHLGYEAAAEIEPKLQLPAAPDGFPVAFASRCPAVVIVDHGTGRGWVVAEDADLLAATLAEVTEIEPSPPPWSTELSTELPSELSSQPPAAGQGGVSLAALHPDADADYEQAVRRVKDYIAAGDVFQVNLSRAWRGRFRQPPGGAEVYRSLCRSNAAPFAGLAWFEGAYVLSSSPERLVEVRGRDVQTRPIAGTRPRAADLEQDVALGAELMGHPKERAEHIMLIDLERNDLGRVCEPGSVRVNELMVLESYAHVHHIVSNVLGRLREDADAVDVIRAIFPGGTITGCPKVRCMEIIAELEGVGRGFYTGSMGYISRDGQMDLNILIRSLWMRDADFLLRTGAGIVADSDPRRELQETEDKARGLLLAVGADV